MGGVCGWVCLVGNRSKSLSGLWGLMRDSYGGLMRPCTHRYKKIIILIENQTNTQHSALMWSIIKSCYCGTMTKNQQHKINTKHVSLKKDFSVRVRHSALLYHCHLYCVSHSCLFYMHKCLQCTTTMQKLKCIAVKPNVACCCNSWLIR